MIEIDIQRTLGQEKTERRSKSIPDRKRIDSHRTLGQRKNK